MNYIYFGKNYSRPIDTGSHGYGLLYIVCSFGITRNLLYECSEDWKINSYFPRAMSLGNTGFFLWEIKSSYLPRHDAKNVNLYSCPIFTSRSK